MGNGSLIARATRPLVRTGKSWRRASGLESIRDVVYALSLLLGITLLLGMGPTLQAYLSRTITSQEANIYDAAYQQAIQKFPDFFGWLAACLDPAVLIASLAVWTAAIASKQARTAAVRIFATTVIVITTLDVAILAYQQLLNSENVLTSVASNIVGGVLCAFIVVLMRAGASFVARSESRSSVTPAIAMAVPLLIGSAISGSVFLVAKTLYDPTPVGFEALVSPKSSGTIRSDTPLTKEELATPLPKKNFRLFGDASTEHGSKWLGVSSPLEIQWKSADRFDLNLYLFEGCGRDTSLPSSFTNPTLTYKAALEVELEVDEGLAEYSFLNTQHQTLSSSEESLERFEITHEDTNRIKTTLFASGEAKHIYRQSGEKNLFLSAFLVSGESQPELTPRTVRVVVDGRPTSFTFDPIDPAGWPEKIKCRPIKKAASSDSGDVVVRSPMASLVAVFRPVSALEPGVSSKASDDIHVTGANGWLAVETSSQSKTEPQVLSQGVSDYVIISGNFSNFQVEGTAMQAPDTNSLQAFGGLTDIALLENGQISLSGKANALYWNQERLNKTRWEKIEIAWATILISWIAGLLFLFYRGIKAALISNYEFGTPS